MTEQGSEAEYVSADAEDVEFALPKVLKMSLAIIFGAFALVFLVLIVLYALKATQNQVS